MKLRQRGYLTETVAAQDRCEDPGGEEGSYGRSSREFYKKTMRQLIEIIPANFVKKGKKAKVDVYDEGGDISGEAEKFEWGITVSRRWMGGNQIDISARISSPSRSMGFVANNQDNPKEVLEDVVDWIARKTRSGK